MALHPVPPLPAGVPPGSTLYYSLRFLDLQRRRAAEALYAVIGALEQAGTWSEEESVARAKLSWWREELARLYGGGPRHPATQALRPWLAQHDLPVEYLMEVLAAVEMDLERTRYPGFRDLRLYCQRRGASTALLASAICGYEDARTPRFAQAVGVARCLAQLLRDVRGHARDGRLYIPEDERARFGVGTRDLLQPQTSERLHALLAFQLQRVRGHYDQALALLPERDRASQHPLLIQVALDQALLDEIERDGLRLLEHRIELPPLRRLWIAWRTRRRAGRAPRAARS